MSFSQTLGVYVCNQNLCRINLKFSILEKDLRHRDPVRTGSVESYLHDKALTHSDRI